MKFANTHDIYSLNNDIDKKYFHSGKRSTLKIINATIGNAPWLRIAILGLWPHS